jgi:hypothetical protein
MKNPAARSVLLDQSRTLGMKGKIFDEVKQ